MISMANENKINVVIELSAFDKGGLEKVVLDSALIFDRDIFDITVVSIGKTGTLAVLARENGINVVELDQVDPVKQFQDILVDRKINLSVSHFSRFGYPIYKSLGIPNITYIHNVYAFLSGEPLQNFKNDDVYVDRYISVSPNATRYAVERIGLSADKIETVPNGLCVDEHVNRLASCEKLDRSMFGIKESDYVFLNVASYNLHKAHYLMADAMRTLLKKRDDIKILCIGNVIVPHHVEGFRNHLKEESLDQHLLMPGYFSNVESLHQISDAFLLPSFIEGWSIAMNEAMFYEKPLILSDTGGSSEVINNNDIGIILENEYGDIINLDSQLLDKLGYETVSYETGALLAAAMENFADNKDKWKEAGKLGKKKVVDNYDMTMVAERYTEIMKCVFINSTK